MKIVSVIVLILASVAAHGADIYFASSAAGSANGTSCANAYARTVFNTNNSNWTPGNTLHLCGTFTAAANADSYLQMQASGTSGNPITIKWESGAIVQAPYFSDAHGGIDMNGKNYITLDGGSNGIVQNTANGSGLTYQQQSMLIGGLGSNDTIKNLSILNVYVHTSGDANGGSNYGILARGSSNTVIGPGDTFTQGDVCFIFEWNGGESNLTINGDSFSGCNQDIEMGPTAGGSFTNVTVSNNTATNWANWDDAGDDYHHNFFHPFTNVVGASLVGTLQIYNNRAVGDIGTTSTSMLFIENNNGGAGGTMGAWYIFNNVFDKTNANVPTSSGLVAPLSDNGYLVNNTFIDAGGTGGNAYICFHSYGTGWTFENNIQIGCGSYIYLQGAALTANYNDYYGAASPQWIYHSTYDTTLASWRTSCSCDAAAIGTNPNLTGAYVPNSGSPVIGAGVNLTSLGIAALDTDQAGTARPSTGAWDIGAYQYSGSPASSPAPAYMLLGQVR